MPKCNLRNLYLSYLLRICFLFEICAFRYTLLYPCPVVKTMDSLSAVNEAFSSSQHPAKQSPKGGKVWLPVSSMYPPYLGITRLRKGRCAQWAPGKIQRSVKLPQTSLWFSGRFLSQEKDTIMDMTWFIPPLVKNYGSRGNILFCL